MMQSMCSNWLDFHLAILSHDARVKVRFFPVHWFYMNFVQKKECML